MSTPAPVRIHDVVALVEDAAQQAMQYYGTDLTVETKSDNSPVTAADMAVHRALLAALAPFGFPVVSEEDDVEVDISGGRYWVVDPLDGTKDFIDGTGEFATMVALVEDGVPVLGVVAAPSQAVTYYASQGKGAHKKTADHAERIHVSDCSTSECARMLVSRNHPSAAASALQKRLGIMHVVPTGSNGIKLSCIAEGSAELYINPTSRMGWWDLAAPQIIVEEAGGVMTTSTGDAFRYAGESRLVADGVFVSNGQFSVD